MTIVDLLLPNWNDVTIYGTIIGVIILFYFIFRLATGFVNPLNVIDKLVLFIAFIDLVMIYGYTILENMLYNTIGQAFFFGALILALVYVTLFYKPNNKKSKSKNNSCNIK